MTTKKRIDQLLEKLKDKDFYVRMNALNGLFGVKDKKIFSAFIDTALNDGDERVRFLAACQVTGLTTTHIIDDDMIQTLEKSLKKSKDKKVKTELKKAIRWAKLKKSR